jgi:hypothetical protein
MILVFISTKSASAFQYLIASPTSLIPLFFHNSLRISMQCDYIHHLDIYVREVRRLLA